MQKEKGILVYIIRSRGNGYFGDNIWIVGLFPRTIYITGSHEVYLSRCHTSWLKTNYCFRNIMDNKIHE